MLRAGQRLASAVSDVEVVVITAPSTDVTVSCGGAPMLAKGDEPDEDAALDVSLGDGPAVGKRYVGEDLGLEVLCTKAGDGVLAAEGQVLLPKAAKPLPSSD
jgi:hypothetical protein